MHCPVPAPTLISCGTYDACPLRCQSPVRKKLFRDTKDYKKVVTCTTRKKQYERTRIVDGVTERWCVCCEKWKPETHKLWNWAKRYNTYRGPCKPCINKQRKLKATQEAS